jgi:hypothetical protein
VLNADQQFAGNRFIYLGSTYEAIVHVPTARDGNPDVSNGGSDGVNSISSKYTLVKGNKDITNYFDIAEGFDTGANDVNGSTDPTVYGYDMYWTVDGIICHQMADVGGNAGRCATSHAESYGGTLKNSEDNHTTRSKYAYAYRGKNLLVDNFLINNPAGRGFQIGVGNDGICGAIDIRNSQVIVGLGGKADVNSSFCDNTSGIRKVTDTTCTGPGTMNSSFVKTNSPGC